MLVIFLRPTMQELMPNFHVKADPRFYIFKTLFQVLLMRINRVMVEDNLLAYSFMYLGMFAVYLILSMAKDQFNYKRMILLHSFSPANALLYGVFSASSQVSGFWQLHSVDSHIPVVFA
mmetsp:Transcript_33325/g.58460  ORF Transcript_33325/g.58460 Transcript_33325/m.58460 type:complete len:119 (-) Transcript_33325:315-671(-)